MEQSFLEKTIEILKKSLRTTNKDQIIPQFSTPFPTTSYQSYPQKHIQ